MITQHRLIGLSAPKSGTMELLDSDKEIFWAPFVMPDDRYKALFDWCKSDDNFWKDHAWIAIVEHDRLTEDGIPVGNQRITEVKDWDLPYKPWNR